MLEEKHRGHDMMHAEMMLILFGALALAQVLLFTWRYKHRKSYQVHVASAVGKPLLLVVGVTTAG